MTTSSNTARAALSVLLLALAASCGSSPSPTFAPLWTVDVGSPIGVEHTARIGYGAGGIVATWHEDMFSNGRIARLDDGAVTWSRDLKTVDMAVSQNGRIHYVDQTVATSEGQVHRIEPTGTQISSLSSADVIPVLVKARDNVATVVGRSPSGLGNPVIVRISNGNAIEWQTALGADGSEGCLYANSIDVSADVVVIGGSQYGVSGTGSCSSYLGANTWVAALSAVDGRELWSLVYESNVGGTVDAGSVAIDDDGIFVANRFGLRALQLDGTEIWRRTGLQVENTLAGVTILSSEALVLHDGNRLLAVDRADGVPISDAFVVPEVQSGSVVFDGSQTLFVSGLRWINRETHQPAVAALRWNTPE